MWSPTHVQVTVQKAWGLLTKGHNNTNDCFVTIALGKVKYETSVKIKAENAVEWHEECELLIPDQGNTAEIILTVYHRNFLGVDEFLGRVAIPLASFDVYERPRNRWYTLEAKSGKENKKERGEIEAKIAFTVKAGSLTDLSKKDKHKSSIGQLSHVAQSVGGSLMSIGSLEKRKGLKKFAKSIGSKMNLKGHKKNKGGSDDDSISGSTPSLKRRIGTVDNAVEISKQVAGDADPGVVSEDEDDFHLDELSHNSSASSLNQNGAPAVPSTDVGSLENLASGEATRRHTVAVPPKKPPRTDNKADEWEVKLYGKSGKGGMHGNKPDILNRRSWESSKLSSQIEEEEPVEQSQLNTLTVDTPDVTVKTPVLAKKEEEKDKNNGMFSKFKNFRKDKHEHSESKNDKSKMSERIIIGGETESKTNVTNSRLSNELLQKFEGKSREDLILLVCDLQTDVDVQKKKLKDLEDYLDDLLLRVMETTPRILQNPYVSCKMAHTKLRNL